MADSTGTVPSVVRAGYVLAAMGAVFAGAALFAPDLLRTLYSLARSSGPAVAMEPAALLGAGLYGAFMVGWGLMAARVASGHSLRSAMTVGAVSWFVVDSSASLWLGFGWNALSNVGFLVVFVLLTRKR